MGAPESLSAPAAASRRAAIYCRISQDSDGLRLGVARQERDCLQLVASRRWTVPVDGIYVDNDLSAFSGKLRPAYERLLRDLHGGLLDAVVAWHPDRLHRSPRELERFIDLIQATGAEVATVQTGSYDLATPSGRLIARQLGSLATYESEHRSDRIKRKNDELAEQGKATGAARTFGYDRPRNPDGSPVRGARPEIIESEAKRVEEAARRLLAGESLYAIVRDWESAAVPTVRGARWSTTALATILKSPRIAGLRVHRGDIVGQAEWDAILDEATWRAVRTVLTDDGRKRTRVKRSYLLSGMLRCALCGHPLVATPRRRKVGGGRRGSYRYEPGETQRAYGCVKANGGCGSVFILAEPAEEFITDAVMRRLAGDRLTRARRRLDRPASEEARLRRQIVEDESALAELSRDYYVERSLPRTAFLAAKRPLYERLVETSAKLATSTRAAPLHQLIDIRVDWPDLSLERRRAVIAAVLDAATVGPATGPRNRFDPTRLNLVWRA